jgi:hypothetical protein
MAVTPFSKRAITCTFKLGEGSFGDSGYNTITIKGLRCLVQIEKVVLPTSPSIVLQIWGMTLDQMNQLTVAGLQYKYRNNRVSVEAGEQGGTMVQVFEGAIYEAYPDFTDIPNVAFTILANSTGDIQIKPTSPTSFKGGTPIETALRQILKSSNLTLENNGVNAVLQNPYFPGTVKQQIDAACRAADCFYYIDSIKKTLAIWPKNGSRSSQNETVIMSPKTGMIGYPTFEQTQIKIRSLFDPAIHAPVNAQPGTKIKVESVIKAASGEWTVLKLSYLLSSEMPNGPWELGITANSTSATIL